VTAIANTSRAFERARRCAILLLAVAMVWSEPAGAEARQTDTSSRPQRSLVGYFPQWGLYNETPYTVKSLVHSGGAGMLDQINYAQAFVTGGRCSVADPNADMNYTFTTESSVDGTADQPTQPLRGNFHQLQELKRMNPRVRIVISLEGRAPDFAADAQPEARAAFVASCVDLFLRGNLAAGVSAPGLFDGIDLDWEFPRGADSINYIPLLEEFRRQMDALRPGLLLTVALGPSPRMYGTADIAAIGRLVNRAGLMTYDFNGPWSPTTGFIAPLATNDGGSVERSVTAWLQAGIPAQKLLVGLPFYGYGWRSVPDVNHGFGQDGKPIRGDRPYRFIETLISPPATSVVPKPSADSEAAPTRSTIPLENPSAAPESKRMLSLSASSTSLGSAARSETTPSSSPVPVLYRDPVSHAPWLFDGDSFWTYEDATSIRSKASFVAEQQLGGFMVWELSEDSEAGTLLNAARAALVNPPPSWREQELSVGPRQRADTLIQ
jgi:chitinase